MAAWLAVVKDMQWAVVMVDWMDMVKAALMVVAMGALTVVAKAAHWAV